LNDAFLEPFVEAQNLSCFASILSSLVYEGFQEELYPSVPRFLIAAEISQPSYVEIPFLL
jgi:hypothetical protein